MSHLESHLKPALGATYRIERELGAGGMATVYLAEDIRHHRKVAIKVLHAELAAVIGADRFLAEIRTIASLQHPHILGLIDSGDVEGIPYFVMPFVDGESLRDRLSREKQLPVEDALRLAGEVADALSHAHAHGVIHRDIKPENILLQSGHALVADFGIALAVAGAGGQRLTQTGLSLGTPAYMSPEQAMGEREITARSDIYALGAVTYEMLTGEAPFTGATMQTIIARVITEEPRPIAAQRKSVPPHVEAAVLTALEKLPADRFASAADFARELRDPTFRRSPGRTGTSIPSASPGRLRSLAGWIVAGVAAVIALALIIPPRQSARMRVIDNPAFVTLDLRDVGLRGNGNDVLSLSNDGRHVALAVEQPGGVGLAIRSLDSLGVRFLARTRGANLPFWSPDGKSLGYFADDSLKTIDVASGTIRSLCRAVEATGGTWSSEGTILFSTEFTFLQIASPSGGGCAPLPNSVSSAIKGPRPFFFPDGKHFVATTDSRVWLGEVGGDSLVALTDLARAQAVFAPPNYLLRQAPSSRRIQAQQIDVDRGRLVGEPATILDGAVSPGGHTGLSASATGVLVASILRPTPGAPRGSSGRSVDLADREIFMQVERGTNAIVTRQQPAQTWRGVRVSRDGRRFAIGGWNVKVADLTGDAPAVRVAGSVESEREASIDPVWAPGDTAIVYVRHYPTGAKIEVVDLRNGSVGTLFPAPADKRHFRLTDWSGDGRRIAFELGRRDSKNVEAWEYDAASGNLRRMFESPADVSEIRYAPSGGWIAYQSTTAGESDVFLRAYPGTGRPFRVSAGGGRWPRWRADGGELYYVAPNGAIMGVAVRVGATPTLGASLVIVPATVVGARRVREFDADPNGRRFQLLLLSEIAELTLVLNWWGLLERAR